MYSHPSVAPAFRQLSICGRTCTLIMMSLEQALLQLDGQNLCPVDLDHGRLPERSATDMHRAVSTYLHSGGKWNFMGGESEDAFSDPEAAIRLGDPRSMVFEYFQASRIHHMRCIHPQSGHSSKYQILDPEYAHEIFTLACSSHPEQRFSWLIQTAGGAPQLHS